MKEANNTVNTAAVILRLFRVDKPLCWTREVLVSILLKFLRAYKLINNYVKKKIYSFLLVMFIGFVNLIYPMQQSDNVVTAARSPFLFR